MVQYINADKEEELAMIENTNVPIMKKAVRVIYDMSEDTRMREMARMREKALHDEATYLKEAREEGRAAGRAEGIKEGKAAGIKEGRAEGIASAMESFAAKLRTRGMSEKEIEEFFK